MNAPAGDSGAAHPSAVICARILRNEPEAVVHMLAENIEALVGRKVTGQLLAWDGQEIAKAFGEKSLYIFPIEDFQATSMNAFLVMDLSSAVHTGASFSLMGPEQVKEVLYKNEIPEILHDSIGEVANIICGAVANFIRMRAPSGAPEFRRGTNFRKIEAGPWPDMLRQYDPAIPWDLAAGTLSLEGEPIGAILLGSSGGKKGRICLGREEGVINEAAGDDPQYVDGIPDPEAEIPKEGAESPADGSISAEEPASTGGQTEGAVRKAQAAPKPAAHTPAIKPAARKTVVSRPEARPPSGPTPPAHEPTQALPPGVVVQINGQPADPAFIGLRVSLESLGAQILPVYATGSPKDQAAALFVVSRSAVDLASRLDTASRSPFRPGLIIACSDRPTHDLVVASRRAGASTFIVLPAHPSRLFDLLGNLAPAAV